MQVPDVQEQSFTAVRERLNSPRRTSIVPRSGNSLFAARTPHNSVCSENRIVAGAGKRLRFKYFGLLRNSMPRTDELPADNIYEPA